MGQVANVALTDTFDTWRVRSNQGFTNLFGINPTANTIGANTVTAGGHFTVNTAAVTTTRLATLDGANTNITGGTLLVTANTKINGTLLVNGAAPGTDDNALAFAIALG